MCVLLNVINTSVAVILVNNISEQYWMKRRTGCILMVIISKTMTGKKHKLKKQQQQEKEVKLGEWQPYQ